MIEFLVPAVSIFTATSVASSTFAVIIRSYRIRTQRNGDKASQILRATSFVAALPSPEMKQVESYPTTPERTKEILFFDQVLHVYSDLPVEVRRDVKALASLVDQTLQIEHLSIEDQHDLGVIQENTLEALTVYSKVVGKPQQEAVLAEIVQQIQVMRSAVDSINNAQSETLLNGMRVNTGFLVNKFQPSTSLSLQK